MSRESHACREWVYALLKKKRERDFAPFSNQRVLTIIVSKAEFPSNTI